MRIYDINAYKVALTGNNKEKRGEDNMSTEKRLMAIKDLQEYLGIPRDRVYQIVKNSDIPSVKIGRSYYVYIDNLNKWLSEKKKKKID